MMRQSASGRCTSPSTSPARTIGWPATTNRGRASINTSKTDLAGQNEGTPTLYIQPLGDFSPTQRTLIDRTAELLQRHFSLPTKVLDGLSLAQVPKWAQRRQRSGDQQILAPHVLFDMLPPRRPTDAVAVLALTTVDLWPGEDGNFVYGQASPEDRVGIWSLARFGDPDAGEAELELFRRRMFRVALHETCHMLGIRHCVEFECCCNGANHLAEMVSLPLYLCPQDTAKIWWACSINPVDYYSRLLEFARKHKLPAEAKYWQSALERVKR